MSSWTYGPRRPIPDQSLVDRVDSYAAATPDAVAVASAGRELTYPQLARASARAAGALVAAGVRPGDRVAVPVERGVDLPVALLAVWRAGAVYTPLDPAHPAERLAQLIADAAPAAVLGGDDAASVPVSGTDAPPLARAVPRAGTDPAYLIYTSGSTGRPKGVLVAHRSLANVLAELTGWLRADGDQRWLAMAPATFDISMAELCLPLWTGARLTITSAAEQRDAARTVRLIAEAGITRMQAVPSQWQALVDAGLRAPGLCGMVGGEALSPALATELTSRINGLVNAYGPTETTVLSTLWPVPRDPATVAIGRPIANTHVILLDDDGRPVGRGEVGELHIGGTGVALGYHGAATDAAFQPDPVTPGERIYRTGDRCRWTPDGHLAYVGRVDGQVKVRGQRVELGEVESALARCPGVTAVAAAVRDQALVAYVTGTAGSADVRRYAAGVLPDAMVPNVVVELDAFPLTPNGKIDRAALPVAVAVAKPPAPAGFADEFLAVVADVLGVGAARPEDDFFELGGHSLAVMRTAAAIREHWHIEVPAETFYDAETLADLAVAVEKLRLAVR